MYAVVVVVVVVVGAWPWWMGERASAAVRGGTQGRVVQWVVAPLAQQLARTHLCQRLCPPTLQLEQRRLAARPAAAAAALLAAVAAGRLKQHRCRRRACAGRPAIAQLHLDRTPTADISVQHGREPCAGERRQRLPRRAACRLAEDDG